MVRTTNRDQESLNNLQKAPTIFFFPNSELNVCHPSYTFIVPYTDFMYQKHHFTLDTAPHSFSPPSLWPLSSQGAHVHIYIYASTWALFDFVF